MSIELVVLVGSGIVVYIFVVLECFVYECRGFVFSKFGLLDKYNLWVILVFVGILGCLVDCKLMCLVFQD